MTSLQNFDDTIVALSSGDVRAGVAVVRASGPHVRKILASVAGLADPRPRFAQLRPLVHGQDEIDRGLVLYFEGPNSFTGEDICEFQIHGSRAVVADLLECLTSLEGVRLADPGEFTRRGFYNEKFDLTEAEGLNDLINAETSQQRRQALRQMEGSLGQIYEDWRSRLTLGLAHIEADIDFPDEDLPEGLGMRVGPGLAAILRELGDHLSDSRRGERLRAGYQIVILGAPNVGKSSLLNFLAQREVAIVSPEAGTTRDVLEVHLDLEGYPVTLMDTAGLREADGAIEAEGIRRAKARAQDADLRLFIYEANDYPQKADNDFSPKEGDIILWNKCDLCDSKKVTSIHKCIDGIPISANTGEGVDILLDRVRKRVQEELAPGSNPVLTRLRHREALLGCQKALIHVKQSLENDLDLELVAEDLRMAIRSLGQITGRVGVEDVLDVIFHEFCIGK